VEGYQQSVLKRTGLVAGALTAIVRTAVVFDCLLLKCSIVY